MAMNKLTPETLRTSPNGSPISGVEQWWFERCCAHADAWEKCEAERDALMDCYKLARKLLGEPIRVVHDFRYEEEECFACGAVPHYWTSRLVHQADCPWKKWKLLDAEARRNLEESHE
jgi:hypothetical protein